MKDSLSLQPTCLPIYLCSHLAVNLPALLVVYKPNRLQCTPFFPPASLPTYLPTYPSTYPLSIQPVSRLTQSL